MNIATKLNAGVVGLSILTLFCFASPVQAGIGTPRGGVRKRQPGLDRRTAASDGGELGRFARRNAARSPGTRFDLPAGNR